jgi:RNA polymerase sigma-70 factor (ECF subfamily)
MSGVGQSAEFSGSTSSSLLERAKSRDPDAWRWLAEFYGPLVYNWARAAGLQPSDAADVAQEVFRSVSVKLADFRHDRTHDSFRGWLWTITRNKVRDYHFQRRRNGALLVLRGDRPRAGS